MTMVYRVTFVDWVTNVNRGIIVDRVTQVYRVTMDEGEHLLRNCNKEEIKDGEEREENRSRIILD